MGLEQLAVFPGKQYRENSVPDVSALAAARTRRTFLFDSRGRFERRFCLTCHHPGRIQIVRNHCLLWNCRRCRSGAVVAAARPRRFQTVESRFVAGCRPFLMRAIRSLTKNINTTRLNFC